MKKVLGFYRTLLYTLNPKSYEGFMDSRMKNTFAFFSNVVFQALVLFLIISIPAIISLPNELSSKFSSVDNFTVTTDFTTNTPLEFPAQRPILVVNYGNTTPPSANVILDHDMLYYGFLFNNFQKNLTGWGDFVAHKQDISNLLAFALVLMAPTLALIAYFYFFVKFLIIAFIASVLGIFVAAALKRRIKYARIFNITMYGISATIFLNMIFLAFRFSFYGIQYLPLIVYLIMGIHDNGEKEDKKMKGKYLEVR